MLIIFFKKYLFETIVRNTYPKPNPNLLSISDTFSVKKINQWRIYELLLRDWCYSFAQDISRKFLMITIPFKQTFQSETITHTNQDEPTLKR